MKQIKKLVREIEVSIKRVDTFLIIIKTLVILMVCYLFFYIVGIRPFYAFTPAVVYFVSSLFIELRVDRIKLVEKKSKSLNEKLRTARDYQNVDNPVLENLEETVLEEVKQVRMSSFLSFSKAILLVFLLVIAITSSIYIASRNIHVININSVVEAAVKGFNMGGNGNNTGADYTSTEESIMQVGNDRLEVEINPVGLDFDFNDVTEEAKYEFSTSFPTEVFISSAAAYESEFTQDQQELIKRYFDKKKKGG